MNHDVWYFAYGSNMSIDQKQWRTGAIRQAIRCRLPGYAFSFTKRADDNTAYANIEPDATGTVWGVAYLCDGAAMKVLDRCEGVAGGHYRRIQVQVFPEEGPPLPAIAYVASDRYRCPPTPPRAAYRDAILTGAWQHGLPPEYIRRLEELAGEPAGEP